MLNIKQSIKLPFNENLPHVLIKLTQIWLHVWAGCKHNSTIIRVGTSLDLSLTWHASLARPTSDGTYCIGGRAGLNSGGWASCAIILDLLAVMWRYSSTCSRLSLLKRQKSVRISLEQQWKLEDREKFSLYPLKFYLVE